MTALDLLDLSGQKQQKGNTSYHETCGFLTNDLNLEDCANTIPANFENSEKFDG